MKITLSFEKTQTKDTSIMVDALRASTTITLALNNFNEIIPCFTPEEAFELKKEINGIIAELEGVKSKLPMGTRTVVIEQNKELDDSQGFPHR